MLFGGFLSQYVATGIMAVESVTPLDNFWIGALPSLRFPECFCPQNTEYLIPNTEKLDKFSSSFDTESFSLRFVLFFKFCLALKCKLVPSM